MKTHIMISLAALIALPSCDKPASDLYSEGYIEACLTYPQHARTLKRKNGEAKLSKYCSCIYENTMSGLNEKEKQIAAFYLYGQIGADVEGVAKFDNMDLNAMGASSAAIGKAVKFCPRP